MKRILAVSLIGLLVSLSVAACAGPGKPEPSPAETVSPDWCVTATPAGDAGVTGVSIIATPAGRTSPLSGSPVEQATLSPSDLATREAQLEQRNRPVELPTGQPGAYSLPVCPTSTPTR